MAVLDCIYLYVPFLDPVTLTVIHVIGAVVSGFSKSPAGPLPNLLFRVAALESIVFKLLNNQEESCSVISSIHPQRYVLNTY